MNVFLEGMDVEDANVRRDGIQMEQEIVVHNVGMKF